MKRKIFSKLLMVALVIAAVGSFVSCKDYDDDINNLQKQIDNAALKSDLAALQQTLTSVQSTASKAATDATSALSKAGANADDIAALKTKANDLGTQVAAAAAEAAKGVTNAATAQAAAETAQGAAETAQAAADAAKTAAQEAKDAIAPAIKDAVDELTAKINAKADTATVKALATKLAEAAEDLGAAEALIADNKTAIEALETKADDFETRIAALEAKGTGEGAAEAMGWTTAITSIDFWVDNTLNPWERVIKNAEILNFQYGKQLDNVFGEGKELHSYEATNDPQTYSSTKDIKAENVYFVRVSPVNADLSKATIKLINSLGEGLDEYVDIEAEPYKELLTRANSETGLWKVTVILKDGVDIAKLQKATNSKLSRDKKRTLESAIYALAVNNTKDVEARLAVTGYNLGVKTNEYSPATDLAFTVNGTDVTDIHNRWTGEFVQAEDRSIERDSLYWELEWNYAVAEKYEFDVPAVKAVNSIAYDATTKKYINNVVKATADDNEVRTGKPMLQVQPEEQIVINFDVDQYPFIDRYYVQFEKDNAIESAPSEYESWLSYNVTGLSTMKKVSERLILTVPSSASEGDVIGFRLYAVNYDGSLVDPDGKAFYVQVGFVPNPEESDIVSGTFTARLANTLATTPEEIINNKANGVIIPFNFLSKYKFSKDATLDLAGLTQGQELTVDTDKEQNEAILKTDSKVNVWYLKSNELDDDDAAQLAAKLGDIKYIAISVMNPENIIDDETIETDPIKIIDVDKNEKVVGYLSFMLKKGEIAAIDPTGTDNDNLVTWKSGQTGTLYPLFTKGADDIWNAAFVASTNKHAFNLTGYFNDLDKYSDLTKYKWTIRRITIGDDDNLDVPTLKLNGTRTLKAYTEEKPSATVKAAATTVKTDAAADNFILTVQPSQVKLAKSVVIDITGYDKVVGGLSRTSLDDDDDPTPAKAHTYQTLTIKIGNVVKAQEYKWTPLYWDAKVGTEATAVSQLTKKVNSLFAKYTTAGGIKLYNSWSNATISGGKVTAAAVQDYSSTGKTAKKIATIYASSTNSAVETFWQDAPWASNHYVGFATVAWPTDDDEVVGFWIESEDGKHNEYIKPSENFNTWAEIGNDIEFTATGAAPLPKTINQTLVIYTKDAFGNSEKFEIPFELVP